MILIIVLCNVVLCGCVAWIYWLNLNLKKLIDVESDSAIEWRAKHQQLLQQRTKLEARVAELRGELDEMRRPTLKRVRRKR